MLITGSKNGSPDMILTAFDVQFHEKKDEIPPRARRPPTKIPKFPKNAPDRVPPPARPPERGSGGWQPPGKGKKKGSGEQRLPSSILVTS